jgi:hypothetical protein
MKILYTDLRKTSSMKERQLTRIVSKVIGAASIEILPAMRQWESSELADAFLNMLSSNLRKLQNSPSSTSLIQTHKTIEELDHCALRYDS